MYVAVCSDVGMTSDHREQRNIFDMERVLMPIFHKGAAHWMSVEVDIPSRNIHVYDSAFALRRVKQIRKVRSTTG